MVCFDQQELRPVGDFVLICVRKSIQPVRTHVIYLKNFSTGTNEGVPWDSELVKRTC